MPGRWARDGGSGPEHIPSHPRGAPAPLAFPIGNQNRALERPSASKGEQETPIASLVHKKNERRNPWRASGREPDVEDVEITFEAHAPTLAHSTTLGSAAIKSREREKVSVRVA